MWTRYFDDFTNEQTPLRKITIMLGLCFVDAIILNRCLTTTCLQLQGIVTVNKVDGIQYWIECARAWYMIPQWTTTTTTAINLKRIYSSRNGVIVILREMCENQETTMINQNDMMMTDDFLIYILYILIHSSDFTSKFITIKEKFLLLT